jgi:MATE family multidrug resistance protein
MKTAERAILEEVRRADRGALSARLRREAGALLALGGPVIGAQLAQISMNFVDAVMAGRLSANDLAAVSIGGSLWLPIAVLGMGILMAVSPTVAHSFGAGRDADIGHHVRQGLWLSLAVAAGSFVAIRNCHPLLARLEVDPRIIPTAVGYLQAVSWGIPASCAFTALRCFSEAVSMTRPILLISLLGLVGNIAGNYVFMHGHLGMPRLGAIGCGVATAMVTWIMLAALVAWIVVQPYYRRFEVFVRFERPNFHELKRLLVLGAPIGIGLFMEGSLFAAVALLLGRFGPDVVAGHQIALNVASISFMVPLGISIAITVRVGQASGRGDARGARRSGSVGAALAVTFMALAAIVMATVPREIAAIYTADPEVQSIAVGLLRMAAIFQIFDGLQVAGAGALRGLKDTAVPLAITFVAYWGLGLPIGYVLGIVHNRGPQAMWVGLIVGLMVTGVLLNLRFQFVMRRKVRPEGELAVGLVP